MKNILKNAEKAEELLKLTSDTMILLDRNGICVDIWGTERNGLTMDSTERRIKSLFIGVSER